MGFPTHNRTIVEVFNHASVQLSFYHCDLGDVGDPRPVRLLCRELSLQQIRDILVGSTRFAVGSLFDWGIWVIGLSVAVNRIYDDVLTKQTLTALAETDLLVKRLIRDMITQKSADSIYEQVGTLRSAMLVVLEAWFTNRFIKEFQEEGVLPHRDGKESRWNHATSKAVARVL